LLIPLSELKPSPWNPKKPLTKKEFAAVKKCVNKFGFQRSLCVCRDFQSGEGFFVLDGKDEKKILAELNKKKVDCHVVEKVTDTKTLQQFMAGYSINKKPLYSEFAEALGEIDFSDFTGLDFGKFSFDVNIDGLADDFATVPEKSAEPDEEKEEELEGKKSRAGTAGVTRDERQTQFFLTLPPDCVEKLRNFVKTKAFNTSKTEAITEKIDAMNDAQFLENILQIIL
jgi:hypothetical protein